MKILQKLERDSKLKRYNGENAKMVVKFCYLYRATVKKQNYLAFTIKIIEL